MFKRSVLASGWNFVVPCQKSGETSRNNQFRNCFLSHSEHNSIVGSDWEVVAEKQPEMADNLKETGKNS